MKSKIKLEINEPSPINIIIPVHDYQTGSRMVSISARRKHVNPLDMLENFIQYYIKSKEKTFPILQGIGKNKYIFSGIIEALGHKKGIVFLEKCLEILVLSVSSQYTLHSLRVSK